MISPGAFIYFILGIISISISGNEVALQFHDGGVNYLITGFMWLFIIGLAYSIIRLVSSSQMILLVILGFISLSVYWFMHAWDVDWIPLFGVKYIPFINLGAMLWILLAILGFSISKYLMDNTVADCDKNTVGFDLLTLLSSSCALISHLVLGGLLTIQIMNLWEAYEISFLTRGLMVSLMWFIYAVLLFRWSYKTNQKLFKIIGILVVLVSSLKVFILDLNGESSVEKIVFLVVFGGVLFLIGKLNQREREKNILPESPSETLEPDSAPAKKHDAFWKKF